jgi:hypothetical protein
MSKLKVEDILPIYALNRFEENVQLDYLYTSQILLSCIRNFNKRPFEHNLKNSIADFVKEETGEDIQRIKKFDSVDELPDKIGDYNLLDEMKDEIFSFIVDKSNEHYIARTSNPHTLYIARIKDGKKLLKTKNVFALLERSYNSYFSRINDAMGSVMDAEQIFEDHIEKPFGGLTEEKIIRINDFLKNSENQIAKSREALGVVNKITHYYHKEQFDVDKGFNALKSIEEYRLSLIDRIKEYNPNIIGYKPVKKITETWSPPAPRHATFRPLY